MSIDEELWKFSDIFFEEASHRYTDSYGTKYTSVTTKVHDFCRYIVSYITHNA